MDILIVVSDIIYSLCIQEVGLEYIYCEKYTVN